MRGIDAGLDGGGHLEHPDALIRLQASGDADRDLFVTDERVVEPRARQAAKDRGAQIERRKLAVEQARHDQSRWIWTAATRSFITSLRGAGKVGIAAAVGTFTGPRRIAPK